MKPEQEVALLSLLRGRDVIVSLPTSYGKSSMMLRCPTGCVRLAEKIIYVIAVSPLVALMKDQVAALSARGISIGLIT